jgi:hypothetical protein
LKKLTLQNIKSYVKLIGKKTPKQSLLITTPLADKTMSNTKLSYWLIPDEPYANEFSKIIKHFANKYNAPGFEPHVTLYSVKKEEQDYNSLLEKAAETVSAPIHLNVEKLSYSEVYTKTFYIDFFKTTEISDLKKTLVKLSGEHSDYRLLPHLSLIYCNMETEIKEKIHSELSLPFDSVGFSRIKAISYTPPVTTQEDVLQWETVTDYINLGS